MERLKEKSALIRQLSVIVLAFLTMAVSDAVDTKARRENKGRNALQGQPAVVSRVPSSTLVAPMNVPRPLSRSSPVIVLTPSLTAPSAMLRLIGLAETPAPTLTGWPRRLPLLLFAHPSDVPRQLPLVSSLVELTQTAFAPPPTLRSVAFLVRTETSLYHRVSLDDFGRLAGTPTPTSQVALADARGSVPPLGPPRRALLSLHLKDADIGNVLRVLSEKSGLNIVTDSAVTGRKITVDLENVTVEQALDLICAANGLAYQRRDNAVLVSTPERLGAAVTTASEAMVLKHADLATVKDVVDKILSSQGSVRVVPDANVLIVTDNPATVALIKQLVASLDAPTKLVPLTTEVISLQRAKAADVEEAVRGLLSPQGTVRLVAAANALVVTDVAEKIGVIKQIATGMDAPQEEPKAVEVFLLRHLSAEQVRDALKALVPDEKDIQANKETNSLTIRATAPVMERLRTLIHQLDSAALREEKHAEVIPLKYADPRAVREILMKFGLGTESSIQLYTGEAGFSGSRTISGSAISGVGGTNGGGAPGAEGGSPLGGVGSSGSVGGGTQGVLSFPSNISTTPRNFLVVLDTPSAIARIRTVAETLDRRPRMLVIEVKVVEVNTTDIKSLGISSVGGPAAQPQPPGTAPATANAQANQTTGNFSIDAGTGTVGFDNTLVDATRIGITLNALLQTRRARLLANPKITTVDGQQAIVFIGDQVPIIETFALNLAQSASTVRFVPVGITLNLKPRLDTNDYITMEVDSVVSLVTAVIDTGTTRAPQIGTREASTLVRVKQGEALIIGGLLREEEINNLSKFPLLGDLPVLGGLFRNRTKSKLQTEIVILLTPKVMQEAAG
jgi:type II secretion system protein D